MSILYVHGSAILDDEVDKNESSMSMNKFVSSLPSFIQVEWRHSSFALLCSTLLDVILDTFSLIDLITVSQHLLDSKSSSSSPSTETGEELEFPAQHDSGTTIHSCTHPVYDYKEELQN